MRLLLLSLLIGLVPSANADSFDSLVNDTELLEEFLNQEETLRNGEAGDRAFEEAEDRFPTEEKEREKFVNVHPTHIQIAIDGVAVVLTDVPNGAGLRNLY